MANQWLRLWHDMPTDPKWRTIAKSSRQRIGDVIAVYTHILVAASTATERGRTLSFNCEDVASALDLETADVVAIVDAMQARVLDGDRVAGWDKRQPAREDGSAERARAWREQKAKDESATNASERDRTQDERTGTQDTEKSREEKIPLTTSIEVVPARPMAEAALLALVEPTKEKKAIPSCPHLEILALWGELLPATPQHLAEQWKGARADHLRARWRETATARSWGDAADGLAYFRRLFAYIGQSRFLTGRVKPKSDARPFVIELEWLVIPANWAKVVEGKYHQEAA